MKKLNKNRDDELILDATVSGKKATYNVSGKSTESSSDLEKLTSSSGKLPQVYGDISQTPSTPGGITDESKQLLRRRVPNGFDDTVEPPTDRYNLVFWIFLINGISTLMPWNMFITAKTYFTDHKFGGSNDEYAKNFLSYLGLCSQVPNLLLNLVNAFAHTGDNLAIRVIISLLVLILVMLTTIILAMVDSVSWPQVFFILTMITVIICNCAVGVYQNCVYGMAAHFPMKYTGAVVLGSNISGTLASFISLLSMIVTPSLKMGAIYYFTTALFLVLLSFDSYFLLPHCFQKCPWDYEKFSFCACCRFRADRSICKKLKFYTYHQRLNRAHTSEVELKAGSGFKGYIQPYVHVFKKIWIHMFNIFFVFFVSLSIFPAMQTDIEANDKTFILAGKFFTIFTCFISFNFFAMIGNLAPNWLPNPGPNYLWIPIALRGLLIPFFFFSNYRPACRSWPVWFGNDYLYSFMAIFLGFTSGYFSSLVMMYAPRLVDKAYARIAAMLATFFLILGIVCGLNNTLFIAFLVEKLGPMNSNSTVCHTT